MTSSWDHEIVWEGQLVDAQNQTQTVIVGIHYEYVFKADCYRAYLEVGHKPCLFWQWTRVNSLEPIIYPGDTIEDYYQKIILESGRAEHAGLTIKTKDQGKTLKLKYHSLVTAVGRDEVGAMGTAIQTGLIHDEITFKAGQLAVETKKATPDSPFPEGYIIQDFVKQKQ